MLGLSSHFTTLLFQRVRRSPPNHPRMSRRKRNRNESTEQPPARPPVVHLRRLVTLFGLNFKNSATVASLSSLFFHDQKITGFFG